MKNVKSLLFLFAIVLAACTQSAKHDEHHHDAGNSGENPNQTLYDQVMDIHDEIMPRAEDIYQLKKELQENGS